MPVYTLTVRTLVQEPTQYTLVDIVPTCGRNAGPSPPCYWQDFLCEPRDKLLQAMVVGPEGDPSARDAQAEFEYLCNETNIIDRVRRACIVCECHAANGAAPQLFKSYDYFRNPEVMSATLCASPALTCLCAGGSNE